MNEKTDGMSDKIYYELRFESKRITEGSAADRLSQMVQEDRKIGASAMIYCDENGDPPIDEEEVFESLQERIEEQIRENESTSPERPLKIDDLIAEHLAKCVENVVWYNCLEEYISKWAELEPEAYGYIVAPRDYCMDEEDRYSQDWAQLQVIWMMCIHLFGNYGTSPRYGWIEKVEEFRRFCRMCTQECIEERSRAW